MKKVILVVVLMFVLVTGSFAQQLIGYQDSVNKKVQRVGDDYPLPVVFPVALSAVKTVDASIKDGASSLYWAIVSFVGVTIGDKVEIRNSRYAGVGTVLVTLTATAANQTLYYDPIQYVSADSGLFYDISLTGGSTTATVVYK